MTNIEKVIFKAYKGEEEANAKVMSRLASVSTSDTYLNYEQLAEEYLIGNEDVRRGIDTALVALTGYCLAGIAQIIISESEKAA